MAPPKIPQIRHAEDVDPSEKDAMHLENVKYFLEHPPEDTQVRLIQAMIFYHGKHKGPCHGRVLNTTLKLPLTRYRFT